MREKLQDPSLPALAGSLAGVLAGFAGILLAWWGSSDELFGSLETPWVVSGGLGGLLLVGVSATLGALHLRRRAVARELVLLDEAELLVHELLAGRS
jgi:hypothetical protein